MLWQRQGMQFYLHFADEKFKSLIEMKVLSQAVSLWEAVWAPWTLLGYAVTAAG